MTFLFFRYLTEKRNLLVQFFSKQEEDRKEILETTGYSCFQIFSVLISKIILQESLTSNFWQEDGSSCILWEFPGKDAISGCRMRGEKLGFFSVFSVLSLIPPFRERRSYGQKFLSFFLFFFFLNFSCRRENFKHFSHVPDQAEQESEQKQTSEGWYKVWKVRSVKLLWRVS